VNWW